MNTVLDSLSKTSIYTRLDLRNACNVLCLREGDKLKTPFQHVQVMPFSLCNIPEVFQRFLNGIISDILGQWVHVYLDDILVYTCQPHLPRFQTTPPEPPLP